MLVQLEDAELPKQLPPNFGKRTARWHMAGTCQPAHAHRDAFYPTDVTTRVEEAGLSNA
jgi:hypothetical protein